jgi:N-acetylneuraminate synthase
VPEEQKSKMRDTPWGKITYLEYKHKIEFDISDYDFIDQYCKEKPIDWSASVWDIDSLEFLMEFDVPFIKIGSPAITNHELIEEAAKTKKRILISTGMSTLEEIDESYDLIMKYGVKPVIMHTNSSYPTPPEELNLSLIPMLKKRYDCIVGYSGHEEDLEPTVIAVALGAEVIERHITLSHDMWGTDQKASLEVMGMDMLKKRADSIAQILGSDQKCVTPSEIPIRAKLRG